MGRTTLAVEVAVVAASASVGEQVVAAGMAEMADSIPEAMVEPTSPQRSARVYGASRLPDVSGTVLAVVVVVGFFWPPLWLVWGPGVVEPLLSAELRLAASALAHGAFAFSGRQTVGAPA